MLENDKYTPIDSKQLIWLFSPLSVIFINLRLTLTCPCHLFVYLLLNAAKPGKKFPVYLNDTGTFENNLVVWLGQIFIFYPPVTIIYTVFLKHIVLQSAFC